MTNPTPEAALLVSKLKSHAEIMNRDKGKWIRFIDVATCTEAVDRIEALTAEVEQLRKALHMLDEAYCNDDYSTSEGKAKGRAALMAARAALGKRK